MGDLSFNVKILADRKIDIRQRKFAGTQGDVLPCKITFDVSAIGTEGKQFKIEWHGCADTYEETILLEAVEGKVTAPVPKSIIDAGGTATAYLLEEVVSETGLVQRICSLPVRLYLGNKATGDTSATISEYNRDTTEMYLAVVNEKRKNDEIVNEAKELAQDSSKAKENYDSAKALYDENVASVGSAKDSAESASASADNASTSETNAKSSADKAKNYFEQTKEIAQGVDGVRYNSKQELTDEQKAQARENIGAIGGTAEEARNSINAQEKFELANEAMQWVEGDEGNKLLRIGTGKTICSNDGDLDVNTGNGLKKSEDGFYVEIDENLVALKKDLTNHNVNEEAHNDIRLLVTELTARINALLDSDDTTLDQMSEIVAYIKANKSLIDSITTSKVNVSDIIDNLTTSVSNKPLSAKQGVMLKSLIDAITVPTKLSELTDDIGVGDKADKTDLDAKADKESDYEIIHEETLTEEQNAFSLTDLNLTKARIHMFIPAGESAVSGYIRIQGGTATSASNVTVGFVSSWRATSDREFYADIDKENGEISAKWVIVNSASHLGSLQKYTFDKGYLQTEENIKSIHLLLGSETSTFPVGTTLLVKGVKANESIS